MCVQVLMARALPGKAKPETKAQKQARKAAGQEAAQLVPLICGGFLVLIGVVVVLIYLRS